MPSFMTFKSHILHLSMKNIHQLYSYMVNNAEISNMFHVMLCHVLAMMNLMFYFVAGSEDTQKSYRSRHRIQKSCGFGSSNRTMSRSLSCDSQSKGSSVCTPRGSNVRWCFLPYRRTIFLCSLVILKLIPIAEGGSQQIGDRCSVEIYATLQSCQQLP